MSEPPVNEKLYQCPECGLHYKNAGIAKKCQAWCKEYRSCNLELIKYAIESQPPKK